MRIAMTKSVQLIRMLLALIVAIACSPASSVELPPAATRTVGFRRDVHPILAARCFKYHAGKEPSSGVRLDDLDEITGESTGAPLVTVGRSAESRLIELAEGRDKSLRMPATGDPLPAEQIAVSVNGGQMIHEVFA